MSGTANVAQTGLPHWQENFPLQIVIQSISIGYPAADIGLPFAVWMLRTVEVSVLALSEQAAETENSSSFHGRHD